MFNSSFSLRQNIKAVDTELSEYKVSNDARVDVLEAFKDTLSGDASGSIADLQTKHEEQATLILTLETNADALKARIDNFNNALGEDGEDGTISTIEQIKLNKDGLAQEIVDRASEITRMEALNSNTESTTLLVISQETTRATTAEAVLQTNINAEIVARQTAIATEVSNRQTAFNSALGFIGAEEDRAILAEAGLQTNITAEATARAAAITTEQTTRASAIALEVVNRNNAIAVETTARETAISTEQTTRQTAIEKIGFISTAEAEGVLEVNSYPFSFGFGNQSEPKYGLPIPFAYTLRGIAYSCISTDSSPEVNIKILHYPYDDSSPVVLNSSLALASKFSHHKVELPVSTSGNLVIQIVSVSGLTDDNSKFRLSLVLTSNESLYP